MFGVWWLTGWDALLLVIGTQLIQMVRQLPPLLRFDGYHLLADVTGVPDLFHRIRPTLLGLLPGRGGSPESRALKPWARAVVTLWVLLVVPLLALTVLVTVLSHAAGAGHRGGELRVSSATRCSTGSARLTWSAAWPSCWP